MDTWDHCLLYDFTLLAPTSKGLCHLAPTHASYLTYHSFSTVVYRPDKLDFLLLPSHARGVPVPVDLPLTPISTGHKSYQVTPIALTCQELEGHYQFALSPNKEQTPKLQHKTFGLFPHLQLLSHHILVIYNLFYLPYHINAPEDKNIDPCMFVSHQEPLMALCTQQCPLKEESQSLLGVSLLIYKIGKFSEICFKVTTST